MTITQVSFFLFLDEKQLFNDRLKKPPKERKNNQQTNKEKGQNSSHQKKNTQLKTHQNSILTTTNETKTPKQQTNQKPKRTPGN